MGQKWTGKTLYIFVCSFIHHTFSVAALGARVLLDLSALSISSCLCVNEWCPCGDHVPPVRYRLFRPSHNKLTCKIMCSIHLKQLCHSWVFLACDISPVHSVFRVFSARSKVKDRGCFQDLSEKRSVLCAFINKTDLIWHCHSSLLKLNWCLTSYSWCAKLHAAFVQKCKSHSCRTITCQPCKIHVLSGYRKSIANDNVQMCSILFSLYFMCLTY